MKKPIKPQKIWPNYEDINPFEGFDDAYLEYICSEKVDTRIKSNFARLPALFWPTELYSFGRCYRLWLKWPDILPIPVYGDHGVALSGELQEHEINNKAAYHLSWYKQRVISIERYQIKKVVHITHPWVMYRKIAGYNLKEKAKGTLIFYPHSIDRVEIIDYDWDEYFHNLESLEDRYKPFVICMHMHDVKKGYHKKLRKYNIPIVSAGETLSPLFVDRFYDLVSNFLYATSPTGGSELFYCEEIGVKYFILGKEPVYYNFSHPQNPLGVIKPRDEVAMISHQIKKELFSSLPPENSYEKKQFVSDVLGLELDSLAIAKKLKTIFFIETIRLLPAVSLNILLRLKSNLSFRIKSLFNSKY
ncbi:hypothetical protein RHG98_00695 [Thermosynechococcus sp. PP22]|uniref:hypothetical protein n=1 Tax=Thermosynechococcus sp. PP22 TaxID=3074082 RepID=UPI002873A94A|nr:hypothetical protein [Thermosynechococcus sp. PP22]WNC22418.1 hypothetical protein RHG98_00695 [Thermosynechococcus sp. PP22]